MAKKTDRTNIFGDRISPLSMESIAVRKSVLKETFEKFLTERMDLSSYFEAMLGQMMSKEKLILFLKLSRWLENQSEDFERGLSDLHKSEDLPALFDLALTEFQQTTAFRQIARKSRLSEVFVTQLFPDLAEVRVPVGVIHQESHHPNHADMVYVCAIAGAIQAKRIFEFGTYRGQTTCGFAAVCKDAQVFTLNLPPEEDSRYAPYLGMFIARSPDRGRIEQIFCDSRVFDVQPYRASMDFIFIDGDHSYEGVKNDTEKALEMLRPGGVIVWHDYAAKSPGVLEYLAEFSQQRPSFRLKKTCLAVYVDGMDPETTSLSAMDESLEGREYGDKSV